MAEEPVMVTLISSVDGGKMSIPLRIAMGSKTMMTSHHPEILKYVKDIEEEIPIGIDSESMEIIGQYLAHKYQYKDAPHDQKIPEFPLPDDPEKLMKLLIAANLMEC